MGQTHIQLLSRRNDRDYLKRLLALTGTCFFANARLLGLLLADTVTVCAEKEKQTRIIGGLAEVSSNRSVGGLRVPADEEKRCTEVIPNLPIHIASVEYL